MTTPTLETRRQQPLTGPATLDAATRTVEVVAATETLVRRGFWEAHDELLVCEPSAVDLSRFIGGPALLDHRLGDVRAVVGTVIAARFEGRTLIATIRFSGEQPGEEIFRKIQEQTIRAVSVGYIPEKVEIAEREGTVPLHRVTRWMPYEASLVTIGADPAAQVRSADTVAGAAGFTEGTPIMTTTPTEPGEASRTTTTIREFQRIGAAAGMERSAIDQALADPKVTIEAFRERAIDLMAERADQTPTRSGISAPAGDNDRFTRSAVDAIAHRLNPQVELPAEAREMRGQSLVDIASGCLQRSGVRLNSRDPDAIFRAAFSIRSNGSYHTTDDFPGLLANAAGKSLLRAYEAARGVVRVLSRPTLVRDFKAVSRLRLSEAPKLLKVTEHGEVTSGTRAEAKEAFSLETFGRIFALTRQAMINDDLGAFADWTTAAGRAAAELESEQFIWALTANSGTGPEMGDGTVLFHTSHHNLAAIATAPSETSLGAARQALREQVGVDGVTPINITAKYLLVSPAMETVADKIVAAITPATAGTVNPFAGKLEVLVEPRLTGNGWYLFADPAAVPVFELAQLASAPGPQTNMREGFDVLGTEFRVIYDLAVAATDWRGAYRNAG